MAYHQGVGNAHTLCQTSIALDFGAALSCGVALRAETAQQPRIDIFQLAFDPVPSIIHAPSARSLKDPGPGKYKNGGPRLRGFAVRCYLKGTLLLEKPLQSAHHYFTAVPELG
eukprot:s1856_g2.t1